MHYPAWVIKLDRSSLTCCWRAIPTAARFGCLCFGPVYVPFGVEEYDIGLFQTPCGPLYVNPGIGWFPFPIRFRCRPELTVFEIG